MPPGMPLGVSNTVDVNAMAASLIQGVPYKALEEGFVARLLALQTLGATTLEEILSNAGVTHLNDWLPNVPDAKSTVHEIYDFVVDQSDYSSGCPCYVVMSVIDMETGADFKMSTGALQVQIQLLRAVAAGTFPMPVRFCRASNQGQGDSYPLMLGMP